MSKGSRQREARRLQRMVQDSVSFQVELIEGQWDTITMPKAAISIWYQYGLDAFYNASPSPPPIEERTSDTNAIMNVILVNALRTWQVEGSKSGTEMFDQTLEVLKMLGEPCQEAVDAIVSYADGVESYYKDNGITPYVQTPEGRAFFSR